MIMVLNFLAKHNQKKIIRRILQEEPKLVNKACQFVLETTKNVISSIGTKQI